MESTRKKLIALLAREPNRYISGQKLSEALNISRSAVWKHMKELEKDGYDIEAVSRKGYRIVGFPDKMSVNTIQWGLKTKWLGQVFFYEDQVDSTQIIAHDLAREGAKHGTVIAANEQLKGRGRLNRSWNSTRGKGIWLSLILRPEIDPRSAPQLTLLTAVAIKKALLTVCDIDVKIKWPNDIFVHDRKLAGILTEMQAEQDLIQYVIIGMGLNVNQTIEDLPKDLRNKAISLKVATGKKWSREPVIQAILLQLEQLYDRYLKEGFAFIKEKWEQSAYKIGEKVTVTTGRDRYEATLVGIHDDGALIVKDDERQVENVLYSAEIEWKRGELDENEGTSTKDEKK